METTLIIYCHPYSKSFNHAVLEQAMTNLTAHHQKFDLIDLYHDHFNPIYDETELSLFHTGQTHDPLVTAYLDKLRIATQLIIITPFWWNSIPGMLKGFVDKVMKEGPGLSHTVTKFGVKGELTNLKRAYVLTTSTSPTFYIKWFLGNSIKRIFINKTLKQLGVQHARWINFGGISNSSAKQRQAYLEKLPALQLDR